MHLPASRAALALAFALSAAAQSDRPLTTCKCNANDATQQWAIPARGSTGFVSSVARPDECWFVEKEVGVCDGLCVTLKPCASAGTSPTLDTSFFTLTHGMTAKGLTFFRWINPADGGTYCVQQNTGKFYIQAWGCTGDGSAPGEEWAYDAQVGSLRDNWRDPASQLCLSECLPPSPSANSAAAAAGSSPAVAAGVSIPIVLVAVVAAILTLAPKSAAATYIRDAADSVRGAVFGAGVGSRERFLAGHSPVKSGTGDGAGTSPSRASGSPGYGAL
jgi:hypothetical protein